jgi:hypothetical protein
MRLSSDGAQPLDAVGRFAADLRELRVRAGSPSYRQLARTTHYSSSTLAGAVAGKRLPTEPVLVAFVTACGGDPDEWVRKLRRAGEPVAGDRAQPPIHTMPAGAPARPRRWYRRGALVLAGCALVAIGATGEAVVHTALDDPAVAPSDAPVYTATPTSAPTGRVSDGTDPHVGGCYDDGQLADKAPVMEDGVQIGALELRYSPRCAAGWTRLYLYPGQPTMLGQAVVGSGDGRTASLTDPLVRQVPVYTDVIVPGKGGCLSAQGVVYTTGRRPLTAAIRCEAPWADVTVPSGHS